jgi:hypothetical protein
LEFTRKGHNVRVLERNNEPDISGKPTTPPAYLCEATQSPIITRH